MTELRPITKNLDIRSVVLSIEEEMLKMPGVKRGDAFPLKHTFVDGAYVREIFLPKGTLFTSKIHKITHPYFILKGDVSVLTEEGAVRIKAPFSGVTKAGTKRLIYAHEDTVWITVHVTKETDLKKIEDEIIAKNFDELNQDLLLIEQTGQIITQNCLIKALISKGKDFMPLLELKPHRGSLLPFKEAIEKLKANNISLEGLYAVKQSENLWHITDELYKNHEGDKASAVKTAPLEELNLTDLDMVGVLIAVAGLILAAIAAGISGYSAYAQGQQQARAAKYNALISEQNYELSLKKQALQKTQIGIVEQKHREQAKRVLASQQALYGKAGVTGAGTPLMVITKTASDAELDALAIRYAGSIEQANIIAEGAGYKQASMLSQMKGIASKQAGYLGAGSALISGLSQYVGGVTPPKTTVTPPKTEPISE